MSALVDVVRRARELPAPRIAKLIREAAGVSQQQLANELGINRVTVARWELGQRRPNGDLRFRYIDLLRELREEVERTA